MRSIAGREELDLFSRLRYVLDDEFEDDLAAGRRRPEWMWVALRGEHLLARAAWWGGAGSETPSVLDVFDVDDGSPDDDSLSVGVRLLRAATERVIPAGTRPPEYIRFVPPNWRDDGAIRRVVEGRMAALEQVGAHPFVERLRFEWRPGTPVPDPTGRLVFRPFRDTEETVALMTRALDGTLDAHSRSDLTRMSPRVVAERHYEGELAHYRSPRTWWRVATLRGGEPAGFVTPAQNDYGPIIAYVAVLPEHRGNGYIDDILGEGTRMLVARQVPRIRAATDLGNTPMASAFRRGGYVNYERAITMTWQ